MTRQFVHFCSNLLQDQFANKKTKQMKTYFLDQCDGDSGIEIEFGDGLLEGAWVQRKTNVTEGKLCFPRKYLDM